LGYVAIIASVIMAAMSGAAAADAAALGSLLIPMMRDAGYNVRTAGGLLSAGSVIAPVIPPSIGFIVFGVIANVSIGKLFLAGIFPGFLMGLSLALAWVWVIRKEKIERLPKMPYAERIRVTIDGAWALFTPFGIIGGLKFGIVTPTEAGVFACVYSFFVGKFVYGELQWSAIYKILISASKMTAVVVFLIATALVSGYMIAISDVPGEVSKLLQPFVGSPILLMLIIQALVVVVGTALDFAPTVLILTPVLMPVVKQAGIDPVYFGVLFIMNNAIGLITPPVGIVLNVICGVAKIPMDDLIKGLWPFLIAEVLALFAMVLFPWLVLGPLKWLI
jgi:tripartite ATP-independent transporter DctM subunit